MCVLNRKYYIKNTKKYKKGIYVCGGGEPSTGPISLQVSRVHLSGE